MNVNEIYELAQFIINKHQNGYYSPSEFNRTMNQAQISYISWLLGLTQTYSPGRPVAMVELGQNAIIRDRIAPVVYNTNLTIDPTGYCDYPVGYLQTDAVWSIYGYQRVRWADQDRWWNFYNSVIDPVTTNPIYMLLDTGFRFAPENIGGVKLSYIKNPPNIVWGYTTDPDGNPVYDPTTSTDPVWDNLSIFEFCRATTLRMWLAYY